MVALIANKGLFLSKFKHSEYQGVQQGKLKVVKDLFLTKDLPYHWGYLFVCLLGLVGHNFLYCVLVGVALGVA